MIAQNKQTDVLEGILSTETKQVFGVTIREPVDDLLERIRAFESQFLKPKVDPTKPFAEAKREYMRSYLDLVLISSYGVLRTAAKTANVAHTTFYRACETYGVESGTYRHDIALPTQVRKEALTELAKNVFSAYDAYIPEAHKNEKDAQAKDLAEKINPYVHLQIPTLSEAETAFEREYVQQALEKNEYNVRDTADASGIQPRTLYRMMDAYQIGKQDVSSTHFPAQITDVMPESKAA